jgi:hypothetical protein
MVVTSFMLGPVCLARTVVNWKALAILDIPILLTTTISVFAFYLQAERGIGRNTFKAFLLMPVVMSLGIGMSINNAFAVVEGLAHMGGEFIRTPKYKIESQRDKRLGHSYAHYRQRILPWVELFAFMYSVATCVFCAIWNLWMVIPFAGLFVFGFGYVVLLNWIEHWNRAIQPVPAKG